MERIAAIFGELLRIIYEGISKIGPEPENISYLAISIILITLIYKFITLPILISTIKMQKVNAKLTPEVKKIKLKYKDDIQTQQRKLGELYKENNYKPLSSCLPLIINMVLVFAFIRVMRDPGRYMFGTELTVRNNFFWIKDLSLPDSVIWGLPLLNGITQYFLFEIMQPSEAEEGDPVAGMNSTMKFIMPLIIFWSALTFSAGLALYWALGNIFEIVFRLILKAMDKRKDPVKNELNSKNGKNS